VKIGILGGGPAGLFSGWMLQQRGVDVVVFEAAAEVGGISRSFEWHGFTCDLGTHRLFTQNESVLRQLLALVPMGRHLRRSQIYLGGKWLRDPVNVVEILYRYSPKLAAEIIGGYLFRPRGIPVDSFNAYVHQKYGVPLSRFFFSPYTEKLFGIPGDEISADWARRKVRISGPLDFLRESSKKQFSYFYYPVRGGYGAIIDRVYHDLHEQVRLNAPVVSLESRDDSNVNAVIYRQDGARRREPVDAVIATISLPAVGQALGFEFTLNYRSVDFVYLLIDRSLLSDNHWIYFMDKDIAINRLVEFKNLSPVDQPPERTVVCAEVTSTWDDVVDQVQADLIRSGLLTRDEVLDTLELHQDFGYPVYDLDYARNLATVHKTLGRFDNLHFVGRSAEFEHLELDDIYGSALALTNELVPVEMITPQQEAGMETQSSVPLVYAVVLTFNHYEDTHECLSSIQQVNYDNLKVLVVDNGSTDGTPEKVQANFPEVEVIGTGHNLGVPWGYNVGFSFALQSGAEYVLMLNNDTIVDPQILAHLIAASEPDPQAGIIVPKILYYDDPGVVWSVGGRYRKFPPAHVILGQDRPSSEFDESFYLEYALSCGLLIHRRAFESAGLFDPGYFFFFDDWDFTHRVRAHGLHIIFVPEAKMWHKVSKSTRDSNKASFFWKTWGESSARFYRRHGQPVWLSLLVHIGYIMVREFIKGNGRMLKHFWMGVRAGLSKPLGPIPSADSIPLPSAKLRAPEKS
jgi:GT2 family glycosyltransferase/protoporphyrinogen oxidase